MTASPVKREPDDVLPGVRTPEDASPETSIATPGYGERTSSRKRERGAKEEDGGDGDGSETRASSGGWATRASARDEGMEARVDALRMRTKRLCGRLVGLTSRRERCVAPRGTFRIRLNERTGRASDESESGYSDSNDEIVRGLLGELSIVERELRELGEGEPAVAVLLKYAAFVRRKTRRVVTLNDLDEDTLQLILSKVEIRCPKELLRLSTVSQRFRKAMRSPTVWRTLDLSLYAATMTNKILYGIVKDDDAFASVEFLNLHGCSRLTDISVLKVLNKCQNSVRVIDLSGCELLTAETVRFIGAKCKMLQKLYLTDCKNIPTTAVFEALQNTTSKVRELRLMGTKHLAGRVDEIDFDDLSNSVEDYLEWLKSFGGAMFDKGDVDEVIDLMCACEKHLERWRRGNAVALCEHANDLQGNNARDGDPICTVFPDCGHVMCVDCSASERRNMTNERGRYVYPCPSCANRTPVRYMPSPGGFEIVVRSPEDFESRLLERRNGSARTVFE